MAAFLPLDGVRVLDMSQVLAGPYAASMLGDLGADVIKVEPPSGDAFRYADRVAGDWSAYFLAIHRNKRAIAIDRSVPDGDELFRSLVRSSDVFIANLKPEALRRKGLDYETIAAIRPDIVYCSVTAFGESGPLQDEPGMDILAQALGGMMGVTGEPGRPPVKVGAPISDFAVSYLAVQGVLAGLLNVGRTGRGVKISINLLDATIATLANYATQHFMTGENIEPIGGGHPQLVPYQVFRASDQYFVVACLNQRFWELLCGALDRPDWSSDPRFENNHLRVEHRDALIPQMEALFSTRPANHWIDLLRDAGVPVSRVNTYAQALREPQVVHNDIVANVEHPELGPYRVIANPLVYDDERPKVRLPAPSFDQDADEIRAELQLAPRSVEGRG